MTHQVRRLESLGATCGRLLFASVGLVAAMGVAEANSVEAAAKRLGPDSAPVQIVVYSDFECPFCAVLQPTLAQLLAKRPADVALEFRHFPLSFHPHAQLAHEAAEFAARHGKFWEFHDRLFANRRALDRGSLLSHASAVGLDRERLAASLDSGEFRTAIEASIAQGSRDGVSGTPAMVVNGRLVSGAVPLDRLERLVDEALGRPVSALALPAPDHTREPGRSRGPVAAVVRVDVYVDLGSPLASRAVHLATQVADRFPTDVALTFRHRPTGLYPRSSSLHARAEQAVSDGTLWDQLPDLTAVSPAGEQPGRSSALATALPPAVAQDVAEADRLGIRGAPAFLVAGRRFDGLPSVQTLTAAVEAALRAR